MDTVIEKVESTLVKCQQLFISVTSVSTSIPLLLKDNFSKLKKNQILISGFGLDCHMLHCYWDGFEKSQFNYFWLKFSHLQKNNSKFKI